MKSEEREAAGQRRFGVQDRWGIGWRIKNQIKRFDLKRSLRIGMGLIVNPKHERPVIILGAPRSGTTLLFRVLGRCQELGHLPREGHIMWRMFHHPRYAGWRSDAIGANQLRPGEKRFIHAYLGAFFKQKRFVEKTPENTLRIPYLLELFPDAHFVVIKRNPCDVINSLINGWREESGRYRSYYVPQDLRIPGHPHSRQWRFALVEGWRDLGATEVPRIAFEQWRQCVEGIQAGRELVPAERWSEVHLETLLAAPHATLQALLGRLDLDCTGSVLEGLDQMVATPVNALSAHQHAKWRSENPAAISALLPEMASLAKLSGYALDAADGSCEPIQPPA
jgi:hypothetical protein